MFIYNQLDISDVSGLSLLFLHLFSSSFHVLCHLIQQLLSLMFPLVFYSVLSSSILYVCIFGVKGASTSKVIGARNEMMMDDYDGQMIFGELLGLKLPDIRLTDEEKPRKNLTQETCPDRGSNPGPLRDKRACYHLFHSGGLIFNILLVNSLMSSLHGQIIPESFPR